MLVLEMLEMCKKDINNNGYNIITDELLYYAKKQFKCEHSSSAV